MATEPALNFKSVHLQGLRHCVLSSEETTPIHCHRSVWWGVHSALSWTLVRTDKHCNHVSGHLLNTGLGYEARGSLLCTKSWSRGLGLVFRALHCGDCEPEKSHVCVLARLLCFREKHSKHVQIADNFPTFPCVLRRERRPASVGLGPVWSRIFYRCMEFRGVRDFKSYTFQFCYF